MRRLYFSELYFPNCIFKCVFFPNCNFPNCIFPNCIFLNCIFPNCIFQTVFFPNCISCSAYVSSKLCECISCSSQSVPFSGLTILIKVGHPWKYWPKSWIFGQIGQFVFRFCFGSGRENHFSWYINKLVNNSHTPHQILILCKINTYYLRCSIPPNQSIHL